MAKGQMIVRLKGDITDLQAKLKAAQGSILGLNKTIRQTASLLGGAFSVYQVINLTKQIITLQAEFSKMMSKVKALTGATDEQTKSLTMLARELGRGTVYTASQAADAMGILAQAGLDVNQITSATPHVLNLAQAGMLDMATAADITVSTLYSYSMAASEAGKITDHLATLAAKTNTNVSELGEAFKMVAPIAATAGISLEDMSAMIGVLANRGIKGTAAGTALRGIISSLAKPTHESRKALEDLGVQVVDNNGNLRNAKDILLDLAKANFNVKDATTLFRRTGYAAGLILAHNSAETERLAGILEDDYGMAAEMAEQMTENLWGDLKILNSAIQELGLSFGDTADGPMRRFVKQLTEITNNLSELVKNPSISNLIYAATSYQPFMLWSRMLGANFKQKTRVKAKPHDPNAPAIGPTQQEELPIPVIFSQREIDQYLNNEAEDYLERIQKMLSSQSKYLSHYQDTDYIGKVFKDYYEKIFGKAYIKEMEDLIPTTIEKKTMPAVTDLSEHIQDKFGGIAQYTSNLFGDFASAFTSGENTMKQFLDFLKKWAVQVIAEMAALTAISGILNIITGGTLGGFSTIFRSLFKKSSLGFVGSFDVGTPYVPRTGLAMVHKGEAIIPAGQNNRTLTAVVSGEDLHFILNEYSRKRG